MKETRGLFHMGDDKNPCYWEGQMTLRCLKTKYREKGDCKEYGDNVKNCRKFWTWVIRDRKRKGIEPFVPPIADKDKIYEEYKHWLGK